MNKKTPEVLLTKLKGRSLNSSYCRSIVAYEWESFRA